MRHVHFHLVRWQRIALYLTGAVLLASGATWLAVHYSIGAGAGELPHPIESWCLRVHGLAATGALFVFGAIAASHIPHGWKLARRRGWASQRLYGIGLSACATLLALTGYALYYFAPEGVRPALGWVHAGIGVLMIAFLVPHRLGQHGTGK